MRTPQVASLPFNARVEEVVALGRLPHEDALRGPRPSDRAAIADAIDRVGLGRLIGRNARELSLGLHPRVHMGAANCTAPTGKFRKRVKGGANASVAPYQEMERVWADIVAAYETQPIETLLIAQ